MFNELKVRLEGISPTIQHNGRLANPRDEISQRIKVYTGKRKKSEEDYQEISHLEFLGGLYVRNGAICWPAENIEAFIREGAKQTKEGKLMAGTVWVDDDAPLIYDGPKEPEKLWLDDRFVFIRGVGNRGNTVMRTRPIFPDWGLLFVVRYDSTRVDEPQIRRWIDFASRYVGLSDYRPRYGRCNASYNGQA